jgi:2-polyprenyl-3-methyl-5-hydroxy-6-metoxy-1,4-benzoquinol methylase
VTANVIHADVQARARLSLGKAHGRIHGAVARLLADRRACGTIADIGCGAGDLLQATGSAFDHYLAIDAVRYDGLPAGVPFFAADLDRDPLPLDTASVDVAAAVEVVEHLENPRAFIRELSRVTKPGGWVVVSTPNQVSALSLLTLAVKGQFSSFQESEYPAHRTALLPVDLQRIAGECGLEDVMIAFTRWGRLPLSPWHYPAPLAAVAPQLLSDNLVMIGRRCASHS